MSDLLQLCQFETQDLGMFKSESWPQLVIDAKNQRVGGDVYYRYNENLPDQAQESLREHWFGQTVASLIYENEIKRLAGPLKEKGIAPVILKGPSLQAEVYDDPGQRPLTDLDLLIKPEELPMISEILIEAGYSYEDDIPWEANNHKQNWINPQGEGLSPLRIEIHTRLFAVEPKELSWETTDYVTEPFKSLVAEDNLVFLMGHLAYQHTFSKLCWLIDIDRLIHKNQKMNWKRVEDTIFSLGIENSCSATLYSLKAYFGNDVFSKFERLAPYLRKRVWPILFSRCFLMAPQRYPFRYYLMKHFLKKTWRDALRYDWLWFQNRLKHWLS